MDNSEWSFIKSEDEYNAHKEIIFLNSHIRNKPNSYPCWVFDYQMPDESPECEILHLSDLEKMISQVRPAFKE